ncbi:uncharacterized protein LOC130821173 isoform X2 [Amaranthus tricolor]|nr:uncharacterized protein LOC130821173 isoform X2 [Amaranthus tricolor]
MKRKRGNKKGKSKKQKSPNLATETVDDSPENDVESGNTDEISGSESESEPEPVKENENEKGKEKAKVEEEPKKSVPVMEVETPVEKKEQVVSIRPEGVFQRPPPTAVYGRVKLKLKAAPKSPLDPPQIAASSEAQIQNPVVNVVDNKQDKEVSVVGDKSEDKIKKSPGIKIVVSSKSSSPQDGKENGGNGSVSGNGNGKSPEAKKIEEQEQRLPRRESKLNKQELETSLEVIKKIMKMDAAEPFNVPVNPVELGIPDYFDVIDTPMDFGTVRSNLESGTKYMDSEDVYKDVQYIWDNCFKYNSKGDYIVDLMKRVKKNFMKYWVAAGLYTEHTKKIMGGDGTALDEPTTSGQGKKLKKGKGVKRHKDDCLCAICIMKRKRRERVAREAQAIIDAGGQAATPPIKLLKTRLPEAYKQQEIVRIESPAEDTSSYMDTSPDGEADVEMEDGETRHDAILSQHLKEHRSEVDRRDKSERSGDISEKSAPSDRGDVELYSLNEAKSEDESGSRHNSDNHKQLLLQPESQSSGYLQQRHELLELEKKRQKQRMLETFRDLENPMVLRLCSTLFQNNARTVWSGANALVRCQKSSWRQRLQMDETVASFMIPSSKRGSYSSLK